MNFKQGLLILLFFLPILPSFAIFDAEKLQIQMFAVREICYPVYMCGLKSRITQQRQLQTVAYNLTCLAILEHFQVRKHQLHGRREKKKCWKIFQTWCRFAGIKSMSLGSNGNLKIKQVNWHHSDCITHLVKLHGGWDPTQIQRKSTT